MASFFRRYPFFGILSESAVILTVIKRRGALVDSWTTAFCIHCQTKGFLMSSPYRSLARAVSIVLVLCLILFGYARYEQSHTPLGRLTAQESLDRSEPICRTLAPQADPFSLSAEPLPDSAQHGWGVTCREAAGREIAHLDWNADTGRIERVGSAAATWNRSRKPMLTRAEAVERAWSWLCALQWADAGAPWRVIGQPSLGRQNGVENWVVTWAGRGYRATLQLEAHSGTLQSAHIFAHSRGPFQ